MRSASYLAFRRAWWALKAYPAHSIGRLLDQSQWWPRSSLEKFRDEKLFKLIDHCYQHVPYYRRIMNERGLKPKDIQAAEDLKKLPVLTKDIVRANWPNLRANNILDQQISIVATGGTTGEPMRTARDVNTQAWASMSFERGVSWVGLTPGTLSIFLTGGSLGGVKKTLRQKISNRLSGQINLPAFELTQENILQYTSAVRRHKVKFIVGYSSTIYHFARLLLQRGEKLNLQAVFTTAERLYPQWADTIRRAMNCKVYSYYGCAECNSMGFQCQQGEAYHIPEEHVILEVELESGESNLLGTGEVLITDLDNYAMPLLRYRNGDYLTLDGSPCSCGRSLRLISKLEGRICEFLLSETGEFVSAGICDFIMGDVNGIDEFQVRQDSLNHVRILVVCRNTLGEESNSYIRKSFRHYLGDRVEVEIQPVEHIPRTKAQKLQVAVNEIL